MTPPLVLVVVLVVAAVYLKRHPSPAILTSIGCGLQIAAALAVTAMQVCLSLQPRANVTVAGVWHLSIAVTAVGNLARAIGMGLLIAAVFVARAGPATGPAPPGRGA